MSTTYYSDSDEPLPSTKLFGRQRPLRAVLGGGKVADVLLWKKKYLSAGILAAVTVLWLLFEVVEYHFLTLACHISIVAILVIFLWSNCAYIFERDPPEIKKFLFSESSFKEAASIVFEEFNHLVTVLYDISRGKDLKLFILAISSLWILSVIGSYVSSLSLLYFCFVCIHTLPAFYDRYEKDVDYLASKATRYLRKLFKKFDSQVINRIPRGPVKQRKLR